MRTGAILLRLALLVGRQWRAQLAALAGLTAATAALLALPGQVAALTDGLHTGAAVAPVQRAALAAFGLVVVYACALAVRVNYANRVGEMMAADLRAAAHARLLAVAPTWFESHALGDIQARLGSDAAIVRAAVGELIPVTLRGVVQLVAAVVLMLRIDARLTALVLLIVPAAAVVSLAFGTRTRRLAREALDCEGEAMAAIENSLAGLATVQAYGGEARAQDRASRRIAAGLAAARQRDRARAALTLTTVGLTFAGLLLVGYSGGLAVIDGRLSGGVLVEFILYGLFAATAVAALSDLPGEASAALAAAERLFALTDAPPALPQAPAIALPPGGGAVRFDAVRFAYPSRPDSAVLDGVSISIGAGEAVAVLGPSGAGKSTLFQLLLGFHVANAGRVLLDGADVARLDRAALRAALAWVPQEPVIFSGTLAENIDLGRAGIGSAERRAAAEIAGVEEFASALPARYDTMLGERGARLSGGQRQRLALARALAGPARVLLLDEITSQVDLAQDLAIHRALLSQRNGRTLILVSHRPVAAQLADRIVLMADGRVTATGDHATLLRECALYRRLIAAD